MTRNYAYCAGLLIALMGSSALAQTHPQKRGSKPTVVRPPVTERPEPYDESVITRPPPDAPAEEPFDYNRDHSYVDHMPTLNGQDAITASMAAIHRSLIVPPAAPEGRVFVQFEVDQGG